MKPPRRHIETSSGFLPLLEQRLAIRHKTLVKATVRALESSTWSNTKLVNLSHTGARFQGNLFTLPGALVVMRIELEDMFKTYELYGVVVWRKRTHFGVQFL